MTGEPPPRTSEQMPGLASLDGVDALVTGGSRGLGLGIAHTFAKQGARVWLIAEDADELERAAGEVAESGGAVEARVVDLTSLSQIADLTTELGARAPDLRVVVNNAGVLDRNPMVELDTDRWSHTLAVNLTAPVVLTRDLLPGLCAGGGAVINVSSRAGIHAFPDQAAYCASKFGLEAFTRCLAMEVAGSRVSVNSVTPGLRIKPTSVTRASAEALPAVLRDAWYDPSELSPAFLFLAGLRGHLSGYRFDARVLTEAINRSGVDGALKNVSQLAEFVPDE